MPPKVATCEWFKVIRRDFKYINPDSYTHTHTHTRTHAHTNTERISRFCSTWIFTRHHQWAISWASLTFVQLFQHYNPICTWFLNCSGSYGFIYYHFILIANVFHACPSSRPSAHIWYCRPNNIWLRLPITNVSVEVSSLFGCSAWSVSKFTDLRVSLLLSSSGSK